MGHQLVPDNIHRKGSFERMTLANRPPINVGVTSSGDLLGSTELVFTDVLGDKQLAFSILSISQYRTFGLSYVNIERRLQYSLQGFWQDSFYFGAAGLYGYAPLVDRDLAESTRSQRGGIASAIYPFNRYTRAELYGGYMHLKESYNDPGLQAFANQYQTDQFGNPIFRNGHMLPVGIAIAQETTVFREYGPVAGNTFRVAIDASPGLGDNWLSRTTAQMDARHYTRLATNGVFAVRVKGFRSWGTNPDFMFYGGNSEMRGYEYLEFYGQHAFFANAELRFPIIEAMLTPLGVLGGLRGVFFFNIGGSGFNGVPYKLLTNSTTPYNPLIGYNVDLFGNLAPIYSPEPALVSGFRLVDGRASYGFGLESHILGFPIHFDWAWRTLFNSQWEDLLFRSCFPADLVSYVCGPAGPQFRRGQFKFWIGYDF
jgi:outer membrane protein assembly factor BamA